MKTFSAKSSAVRAAANHFKVKRNMAEVLKVAVIKQNTMKEWFWEPIAKKVVEPEAKKVIKPEAKKVQPKTETKKSVKKEPLVDIALQAQLQELSMGKLSVHYNAIATQFGEIMVTRFAHKKEAVKRTMAMHLKHLGNAPI